MFSSRIIRKGSEEQRPYTLEPLGEELPELAAEPFRAIALGGDDEPEEEAEPEAEVVPELPPMIPEEEAHRMIQEAHAAGLKEGREEAEAAFAQATEALGQALLAVGALRGQLLHEAEDDLLRLSVLIARKVMHREFACDPGIMAGLVRGALELASDEGGVVVRLNPEEYQIVAFCREFEELLRENPRVVLKPDAAVGRAGCLVETTRGNIDAGVDAQLDDVFRRLCDEKSEHREELE